ncbi:MAG: lytic murein transglycosylase B [Dechloromonas sp.]|nr:lytic murein transglycosylase B [Dechloromonas sp.]
MKFLLPALLLALLCPSLHAASRIADSTDAQTFAVDMEKRHGFSRTELLERFAQISPDPRVLRLIAPPSKPGQRSWARYQPRFLNEQRIAQGVEFWQNHAAHLARARALYGVPEEIIVAIIGVETVYGRNTGGFRVLDALATLAFSYPPRAEFFRTELEQFFLLARENGLDPAEIRGSYAGAIGIPQFMPGSQRRYAIDFDGDQRIDLSNSDDDAIGSVAHFLLQHGWQSGQPIAVPARLAGPPANEWLEAGIQPRLLAGDLLAAGVLADTPPTARVTLVDLITPGQATEYWLGFDNFYVITRYNRSSFYAMSVFQLAEAIRQRMPGSER